MSSEARLVHYATTWAGLWGPWCDNGRLWEWPLAREASQVTCPDCIDAAGLAAPSPASPAETREGRPQMPTLERQIEQATSGLLRAKQDRREADRAHRQCWDALVALGVTEYALHYDARFDLSDAATYSASPAVSLPGEAEKP